MKQTHNKLNATLPAKYEIFLREKLRVSAKFRIIRKHEPLDYFYNVHIINDLIFNQETHLVILFREYCLLENTNEYLRRFYFKEEAHHKMPKILYFYEKFSKIYPNYTSLPESKYMYKNIKRKQKMIDKIQNQDRQYCNNTEQKKSSYSSIFKTNIINSIYNQSISLHNIDICNSQQTQNSSIDYSLVNLAFIIDKIDRKIHDKSKNAKNNKTNVHLNIIRQQGNKQHTLMSSLGKYKSFKHTHFFSKNNNYNKKTISASNSTNTTTINKKTSVLIQNNNNNNKSKIISRKASNIQNLTYRNKHTNDIKQLIHNRLRSGNKTSCNKGKTSYTNTYFAAKSSNVSHSKTERIISSPVIPDIKRNLNYSLTTKKIKKRNNIKTIKKNKTKKTKTNGKGGIHNKRNINSQFNNNNNFKPNECKHRNLYTFLNNINHSDSNIKSKSTNNNEMLTNTNRKHSPNNNSIIVSTIQSNKKAPSRSSHVINNVHQLSNHVVKTINIHNICKSEMLKNIYINSHSTIIKHKISQKYKQQTLYSKKSLKYSPPTKNVSLSKVASKYKQHFDLNIKKIINKKLFEQTEPLTERITTKSLKNSLMNGNNHNEIYYNTINDNNLGVNGNKVCFIEKRQHNCKRNKDVNNKIDIFQTKLKSLYNINNCILKSESKRKKNNIYNNVLKF